jgi:hypothetical protein
MNAINYLAVLVSAVAGYAASFVWFIFLFFEPYKKALGKTAEEMAKGPNTLQASLMQVVGNAITALVLAWLMNLTGYTTLGKGVLLAALVWVGFVAAVLGPMYAFQAFGLSFFFITAGSVLITLLIMGGILGAWR